VRHDRVSLWRGEEERMGEKEGGKEGESMSYGLWQE